MIELRMLKNMTLGMFHLIICPSAHWKFCHRHLSIGNSIKGYKLPFLMKIPTIDEIIFCHVVYTNKIGILYVWCKKVYFYRRYSCYWERLIKLLSNIFFIIITICWILNNQKKSIWSFFRQKITFSKLFCKKCLKASCFA